MPKTTLRERALSKLLDEVISLFAFSGNVGFAELAQTNHFVQKAYEQISLTRKLANMDGVEYPITLALFKHLIKERLLWEDD